MDANGLRFWLLADGRHFPARRHAVWDRACRVLRLASERTLPPPANVDVARGTADSAIERMPHTLDAYGSLARWIDQPDAEGNVGAVVVSSLHLPSAVVRLRLHERPSDLAVGHDGVLYVALADRILMHDLRGRWRDEAVQLDGFAPWRLATDADGGAWALDRAGGRLARLQGRPMPQRPHVDYAHTTFRPSPENGRPPGLRVLDQVVWRSGERPVALAAHPQQGLAMLSWTDGGHAFLRRLDARLETLTAQVELSGARYAYALAWLDDARMAVRLPGRRDAPAFAVEDGETDDARAPLGEIFPLADDAVEAPFVHRLAGPPHYPTTTGSEPLHALSIANLARHGEAESFDAARAHLIDSGSQVTVWHRLYAEASIPPGSGFIVWLAATAEPEPPSEGTAWCAHRFGRQNPRPAAWPEPQAAWEPYPSELPAHPGLGPWTSERDRSGLFSVLIQNPRRRVRSLIGRYLWVRVELFGDGRVTPEIAALRCWASRLSYRDQYLPRLYREQLFGAPALAPGERIDDLADTVEAADTLAPRLDVGGRPSNDLVAQLAGIGLPLGPAPDIRVEQPGRAWLLQDTAAGRAWPLRREADAITVYRHAATPADFLERFLLSFEAMLTPLEDRVAAAHLLTDPVSAPADCLDWLAAWIGLAFDPALPAERRREWLAAAPRLARLHGTRHGLALALDLASGGGVRGGEIVLVENFRLRRLLATLLGVDLADEADPLLPGLRVSGNSVVGDTLILAEAETAELLALFREEVASVEENAAVRAFYERLAHRATVLVHQSVSPQDLGLLRRVVELEAPAHVEVRVLTATWPFLVGIASLVGVDTYLGPPRSPQPARPDVSFIGMEDFVLGPVSLDPRRTGGTAPPASPPPVANAGFGSAVPFGRSFILDGRGSRAGPGRRIETFRWTRLPPPI